MPVRTRARMSGQIPHSPVACQTKKVPDDPDETTEWPIANSAHPRRNLVPAARISDPTLFDRRSNPVSSDWTPSRTGLGSGFSKRLGLKPKRHFSRQAGVPRSTKRTRSQPQRGTLQRLWGNAPGYRSTPRWGFGLGGTNAMNKMKETHPRQSRQEAGRSLSRALVGCGIPDFCSSRRRLGSQSGDAV